MRNVMRGMLPAFVPILCVAWGRVNRRNNIISSGIPKYYGHEISQKLGWAGATYQVRPNPLAN